MKLLAHGGIDGRRGSPPAWGARIETRPSNLWREMTTVAPRVGGAD